MSAKYISSTFFKAVTTTAGRPLRVNFVDETTAWVRPSDYPAASVKKEFTRLVEEQGDKFKDGVSTVAMK